MVDIFLINIGKDRLNCGRDILASELPTRHYWGNRWNYLQRFSGGPAD